MSTLISEFYEPVRALLGDFNATVQRYEDNSIKSLVKTMVRGGRLTLARGRSLDYVLTVDGLGITPDVTNPDDWIYLAYLVAHAFVVPNLARYSYTTRAIGESFGEQTQVMLALEEQMRGIENGDGGAMFSSWQSLAGWLAAQTGEKELWNSLVEVKTTAPIYSMDISQNGVTLNR